MSLCRIIRGRDHFRLLSFTKDLRHVTYCKLSIVLFDGRSANDGIDTASNPAGVEHSGVVEARVLAKVECQAESVKNAGQISLRFRIVFTVVSAEFRVLVIGEEVVAHSRYVIFDFSPTKRKRKPDVAHLPLNRLMHCAKEFIDSIPMQGVSRKKVDDEGKLPG